MNRPTGTDPSPPRHPAECRPTVSAFVVCCNEETKIRRCLDSVTWCDEIVVVDSGSTDRTLEICREFTDRIFSNPWPGYVLQKKFGLERCRSEWILNLDADEEVSPELAGEIRRELARPDRADGYYVSRVVFYLGRWWRKGGWYPEYRLRLCRRAVTSWAGRDPHEKAVVKGVTRRVRGELRHYTYADVTHQVSTLNNYSLQAARSMAAQGRPASIPRIFLNPVSRFVKFYVVRRGFLEGFPGLLVAILESYYVFLKYMKLWEMSRTAGGAAADQAEAARDAGGEPGAK